MSIDVTSGRPHGRSGVSVLLMSRRRPARRQQTLKTVKERGSLICGVSQGVAGFSLQAGDGQWTGFDVDFCRALAAAIFNDPTKVNFVPLSASDRFAALQAKQIDVLSRNSTWTMARELEFGLAFAGRDLLRRPGLHGAAFPQRASRARARRQQGLRADRHHHRGQSAADFFKTNGMKLEVVATGGPEEVARRLRGGALRRAHRDVSQLYARAAEDDRPGRSRSSCPRSSPRSRSARRCGRTIRSGSTS